MKEDDDGAVPLSTGAIAALGLNPEVSAVLHGIQAELNAAYQKHFVDMLEAIRRQASALERLQTTLNLLVESLAPEIKDRIPVVLRVAQNSEAPDITSPVVVADPIATGYTMTQANLASALGLSAPDVSVFARAFQLTDDGECAVVVRKGKLPTVNYHPRAIARFRELVASPPATLTEEQQKILARVKRRLRPAAP